MLAVAIQHGRLSCRAFHAAHHPLALALAPELGPGLDPQRSGEALARLCAEPDVQAVIAFGSRASPSSRLPRSWPAGSASTER